MRRILILALVSASLISAQSPPAFDVASVKHHPFDGSGLVGIQVRGDTLTADHTCLYGLVSFAYNLREGHLSGGPSWAQCVGLLVNSDLYQVIGKTSGDPPPSMDQFRLMLQTLLADRFQLRVRHIQKELPTYNLVAAPRGTKLKESAADAKTWMNQDARGNHGKSMHVTATHFPIAEFVNYCEIWAGRPTIDQTGLGGFYDFELSWDSNTDVPGADPVGQDFATALEKQLGLKLEPATGSFDTVAIDHAEKPSEN
jgi:uncharacterized protein (TIGR03435 family)